MKKLKIYNTLTRQKEDFIPFFDEGKKDFVGIYSCGPTVYDEPHFGNLRAMVTADMIRNVVKYVLGYPTKSVSNFTDVGHMVSDADTGEDKMEKGSRKTGLNARELAKHFEKIFVDYSKKLNIEPFDYTPRATEFIKEQLEMVLLLEKKGYTYEIPGDGIYFDTSKIDNYGELLGPNYKKHLEGICAGERVDCVGKKNPTDFALWKFSPKDEKRQMEWDSPWGKSFPGWHIECSAMSRVYLGDQFDIHHGGYDLIPVHHTNEIAQSQCAYDVNPWVKYWLHNQFVTMAGEKMSKSKGNYVAPKELLEKGYDFLDLRYFFLQVHYRSFVDFSWETIKSAKNSRKNLTKKIFSFYKNSVQGDEQYEKVLFDFVDLLEKKQININNFEDILKENDIYRAISESGKQKFDQMIDAILDDFNTAKLIALLNECFDDKIFEAILFVFYFDKVLLRLDLYKDFVFLLNKSQLEEDDKIVDSIDEIYSISYSFGTPDDVVYLAKERYFAKKSKEFTLADEIRNKLETMGYKIIDSKDGLEILKK